MQDERAPIRAVTIDLWYTLLQDTEATGEARAIARLAALRAAFVASGLHVPEDRLLAAYTRLGEVHASIQEEGRDLTMGEHVARFIELLDLGQPVSASAFARIRDAYIHSVIDALPVPMPGASELLSALRTAGLPLALISNAGRTPGIILRHYLEAYGMAAHFETLIFSDEVGLAKPNPAIFALALERLGVRPENAAHVGDDLVLDLLGAQRAGMRAIIIRPERPPDLEWPHQWAPDLERVLVCFNPHPVIRPDANASPSDQTEG